MTFPFFLFSYSCTGLIFNIDWPVHRKGDKEERMLGVIKLAASRLTRAQAASNTQHQGTSILISFFPLANSISLTTQWQPLAGWPGGKKKKNDCRTILKRQPTGRQYTKIIKEQNSGQSVKSLKECGSGSSLDRITQSFSFCMPGPILVSLIFLYFGGPGITKEKKKLRVRSHQSIFFDILFSWPQPSYDRTILWPKKINWKELIDWWSRTTQFLWAYTPMPGQSHKDKI